MSRRDFRPPKMHRRYEVFSYRTLRSYPMPTFFEKIAAARPAAPDRAERNKIAWDIERGGAWEGQWYGVAYDNTVVAFLRPVSLLKYSAFYVGYGAMLELPEHALLETAKAWAQERHNEALAAQVEQLLEKGNDL